MIHEENIPKEGDLHSVVTIGVHRFELRYGYWDERDRITGEPYILYPDLAKTPHYKAHVPITGYHRAGNRKTAATPAASTPIQVTSLESVNVRKTAYTT